MTKHKSQIECDAVLFDLDGVLIDSTSCIVRHWKDWADQHSLNLDEIMQAAHGIPTIDTIRMAAPHLNADKEAERFTAKEVSDTDGVFAIQGAHRILEALPEGTWAIVTSGGSALARARLAQAELPIPRILITIDDVQHGKPAPEPYLIGAKRLGIPIERCVAIEDAPAGVEAGVKAGMRVIGISATHNREILLESGADIVVGRLMDLIIRITGNGDRKGIQIKRSW